MSKIIILKDKIIDRVYEEVYDILFSAEDDYDIPVTISALELRLILSKFYDYYASKEIVYDFSEYMIGHFEDIAITAVEENEEISLDFILNGIGLFELLDSRIEVNPKETKILLNKIKKTIEKGKR